MATLNTDLLAHLMRERGIDGYAELARLSGISRQSIWKARKGVPLRPSTLRQVEAALEEMRPVGKLIRP